MLTKATVQLQQGIITKQLSISNVMFQRLFGVKKTSTSTNMTALKESIQEETAKHEVVVYSKTYCPYCINTKNLFGTHFANKDVKVVELDRLSNGGEIQRVLAQMTGQRTVPSVWVKGNFVGGNDDTVSLYHSGKLAAML